MPRKTSIDDLVPRIDAVAANVIVSAATFAALVKMLRVKGQLTEQEVREVYEDALLMLEEHQGADPATDRIYEAAREVIEEQLRG